MPDMRMGNLGSKNFKVQWRGKKRCADQGRTPEGARLAKFEGPIPDYIRGPIYSSFKVDKGRRESQSQREA